MFHSSSHMSYLSLSLWSSRLSTVSSVRRFLHAFKTASKVSGQKTAIRFICNFESIGSNKMEDDDSCDDSVLPSAAECDRRCKEFAAITCTDSALAMFFLQDRDWSLDRAIHDYFDSSHGSQPPKSSVLSFPSQNEGNSSGSASTNQAFVDSEPHRIRILSWNIDGLDQNNIATRASAACQTILQEKPDVVFLQEVVNKNLAVIREKCSTYRCILGSDQPMDGEYFVAVLLRRDTTMYDMHEILPFYSSQMSRNLLTVQAKVKGIECVLVTSHLESTAAHYAERQRQLGMAFELMNKVSPDQTVIFGGDLNLRDKELRAVGGIPPGIVDVWQSTGSRPEAEYTWDTQRNDNLVLDIAWKCRCRFDRLYYRTSGRLKPVYFELVGLQRIPSCHRFTSDHWGILAHFDKK